MAGHSKWAQIKRSKAKIDAQRGKLFSRLSKDIMSAVRQAGPNPDGNLRLKIAIQNAKDANMPAENIQRAILKASGQLEGARMEEAIYEGYGPGGVAIMMEIATDNRNRTAADVRAYFNKLGGNLGETGSVGWMFDKKGVVAIDRSQTRVTEDDLLAAVLEAGAEDIRTSDDRFEVICAPEDLEAVLKALEAAGIPVDEAGTQMLPQTTVTVAGETAQRLVRLLEALEDLDDVQNVYSNADFPDGELEGLED